MILRKLGAERLLAILTRISIGDQEMPLGSAFSVATVQMSGRDIWAILRARQTSDLSVRQY